MKGLLITLVVIGHLPFFDYDSRTLTLIYSFHMHAFLIIGGILSHVNEITSIRTIIRKRVKGILIPYIIFYIISFIIIPIPTAEQRINAIMAAVKGIGVPPGHAINLPLWFLTFYFVAMILFEIIEWLSYRIKIAIYGKSYSNVNEKSFLILSIDFIFVALIMFASFMYARYYKMPRLPFNIEIAGFCLGFVFFGKLIGKYLPDAINEIKKNTSTTIIGSIITILLIIIFIYSWYILSMRNGRIDLNARDYKNAFLMYVNAILAFSIFAFFSYFISLIPFINNFLGVIGENSIYILAFHVPSVIITHGFIIPLLPQIIISMLLVNSIFSVTVLTLFGILFSLIPALICKCIHFSA